MEPRIDPSAGLLRLARRQGWVLTTEQARRYGLGRRPIERLISAGRWRRLTSGVYYLQSGDPPWLAYAWAGVLIGGPEARLSGEAASYLHGLRDRAPKRIQVLIPEHVRRADRGPWQFRRERAGVRLRSVGLPPRTPLEDTVLDLCAGRSEHELIDVVTTAIQSRRTSAQIIVMRLEMCCGTGGQRLLRAVLADVAEGAESPLELAYLRGVERAHRLPRGRRQVRHERQVRDVVYEEYAVVAELDGRLGHEGVGRFRDMERDNLAAVTGLWTLRFGWHDVRGDPCRVAGMVSSVLRRRGWTGELVPCRRCKQ